MSEQVWSPVLSEDQGPQYRAIVTALERDLAEGRIRPGVRLPARRSLAETLGVSLGTVTRAYEEMERRGLVRGQVGRGTFVISPTTGIAQANDGSVTDLGINISPDVGEEPLLRDALRRLAKSDALADCMAYLPHLGLDQHRHAVMNGLVRWRGHAFKPAEIALTNGAQHSISLVVDLFAQQPGGLLSEGLTYTGVLALARHRGLPLRGVAIDEDGMRPDSLAAAARETGARLVHLTPNLQSPTATVMSEARRHEIVAVARELDLYLLEDDVYGFLCAGGPSPLQSLAPERTFYVSSFAKCLFPGVRLGMVVFPGQFAAHIARGLRTTSWMASPMLAALLASMSEERVVDEIVARKRVEAKRRTALARKILGERVQGHDHSFHLWMPLPDHQAALTLVGQAAANGIVLTAPEAVQVAPDAPSGVRLCLGTNSIESLDGALQQLDRLNWQIASRSIV
ncbi:MAG TPA: PLP-dependent aminotransferase family protein [Alphaproteobacteria bacterium]